MLESKARFVLNHFKFTTFMNDVIIDAGSLLLLETREREFGFV